MQGILPDEIRAGRKDDPVLEARTARLDQAMWRRLAREAQDGLFDADIPWLDMTRFRAVLTNVPEPYGVEAMPQFIRMTDALYVWGLWQRYCAR
jgi:hypothetical protein